MTSQPPLRPPLRKPHPQIPPEKYAPPPVHASPRVAIPPDDAGPQPVPKPAKQFFCRNCDRREMGRTPPPGWLSLQRHIARESLLAPEDLTERERKIYRKRDRMSLGLYCNWDCFVRALPRLGELYRELNQRGIGLKPLLPGEVPPPMPPAVTRGGPK